jgi:transposase-like protein
MKQQVIEWVKPESIVYTDEWPAYNTLYTHFDHSRVRHASGEYVIGDAHTNTIEGFFGNLKTGVRGNYKKVSHRWLQGYLNEFTFRYNHRSDERAMFQTLLLRAAE